VSFKDIAGHKAEIDFLESSIASGRVSHAYLFAGMAGIGKKASSVEFAKALNCLAEAQKRPCDSCASCRKIISNNHPDVAVIVPQEDKKEISIDQVRHLSRQVSLKAYEARRKVYILDGADNMGHAAQNALLKTLEEPGGEATIILIAENMRLLPQTIVSRSQPVRFYPLRADDLEKLLAAKFGVEAKKARVLSRMARGSVSEALALNGEAFFEKRSRIIDMLKGADTAALDAALEAAPKDEARRLLEAMLCWYRDVLVARAGLDGENAFINSDRREAILKEAKMRDNRYLNETIERVAATISYLDNDANQKLAMAVLSSRL
jgi:DNA polymerase-3 subunit delta'